MTSTREPDAMTPDERRQEVAAILARGLLRRLRAGGQQCSEKAGIELDLPAETRLTGGCAAVADAIGPTVHPERRRDTSAFFVSYASIRKDLRFARPRRRGVTANTSPETGSCPQGDVAGVRR